MSFYLLTDNYLIAIICIINFGDGDEYMFKMTKLIYDELGARDSNLGMFIEDDVRSSQVWIPFNTADGVRHHIHFINRNDDNDTAVRVYGIVNIEEDRFSRMLPALNYLNGKFRFVKFHCDDYGDINLYYDFLFDSIHPEKCAMEILVRIESIIEEAYPILMRAAGNSF